MVAIIVGTNSYVNLADADTYMTDRFNSEPWFCESDVVRMRGLITASKQITLLVKDECKLTVISTIDSNLEAATAELAIAMIIDPAVATQESTGKNIKKAKAGTAEVTFFKPTSGTRFPSNVMLLLAAADCIDGAIITTPFASGTSGTTAFCDDYGKSRGFY